MRSKDEPQIFRELPVDMKIGTVLGPTYQQVLPRRVWINTDDAPVTTALDLSQKSQWSKGKSYATIWAFIGTKPPEDFFDWHLRVRLERVPQILAVSGQHIDELPRHLEEWDDPGKSERDAAKIAQAARLVFGQIRTPEGIIALTKRLGASDPRAPRILGMTGAGQKALGIRIT